MYALWNKITIKLILCYNLYASFYSIYSKLSCNFIEMRLRSKCPLVNMLHIFGAPIRKYTTRGLLVGEIISVSKLFSWLEYHTSSILLCSYTGADCLNRVCTQKTFNLSRSALSIITFVTLFRVNFLNLLFGCVCGEGGRGAGARRGIEEGGGRTAPMP